MFYLDEEFDWEPNDQLDQEDWVPDLCGSCGRIGCVICTPDDENAHPV